MTIQSTLNYLEGNIYKCFEGFRGQVIIKVSDFVRELNIKHIVKDRRVIRFPTEAMIRALLFMRLKGIKSQSALMKHLRENPEDRIDLGLKRVPDQRSISYFLNVVLDMDERRFIGFITNKTEEIAQKFGIIFDVESMQIRKKWKGRTKKTFRNRKRKKLREVCRFVKKNIYPNIKLDLRHNAKYKKSNFLDLLVHIAIEGNFTEGGFQSAMIKWEERSFSFRPPNADTLLYHIKKYENIGMVQDMFMKAFDAIYGVARTAGLFDPRKSFDIAIDFTDWFYYGDKTDFMVVEKKPERGTTHCFRFATINIVDAGRRFTLIALPVGIFNSKEEIVEKLLKYTMNKIRIRKLYMDRGFFSSGIINLVKSLGITFLMPAVKNKRIMRIGETMPTPSVIKDYEMKDSTFNLVVLHSEKMKGNVIFATNMHVNEKEVGLTERLFSLYSKRWGVETSYRVKKEFRPRTTSKNYIVRLFYFLFSTLLYNLWVIINILISKSLLDKVSEIPVITADLFGTVLYIIVET